MCMKSQFILRHYVPSKNWHFPPNNRCYLHYVVANTETNDNNCFEILTLKASAKNNTKDVKKTIQHMRFQRIANNFKKIYTYIYYGKDWINKSYKQRGFIYSCTPRSLQSLDYGGKNMPGTFTTHVDRPYCCSLQSIKICGKAPQIIGSPEWHNQPNTGRLLYTSYQLHLRDTCINFLKAWLFHYLVQPRIHMQYNSKTEKKKIHIFRFF